MAAAGPAQVRCQVLPPGRAGGQAAPAINTWELKLPPSIPLPLLQVLLLYRRILKAAAKFPSIKRGALIEDIKHQFRDHKAGVIWGSGGVTHGVCRWQPQAAAAPAGGAPNPAATPPSVPALPADLQALEDPAKVRHELGVALRSLEQLESYAGMDGKSADLAVSLKGSCD